MKCLNIIVYYDNFDEVITYLREILNMRIDDVDIMLVKNKDSNNHIEKIYEILGTSSKSKIQIVDFGGNVGYLNALLYSIKTFEHEKYKYIILSNTDIHYESKDFFRILLKNDYSSEIGCIAPSIYDFNTKSYSNPHYISRIKKEKLLRLKYIFSHPLLARIYLHLSGLKSAGSKKSEQPSRYVYSPHGCYMIFTNAFIKDICGYRYEANIYSEESCVGELLIRSGKKCYYDPSLKAIHYGNSVTGKINYKKRFYSNGPLHCT